MARSSGTVLSIPLPETLCSTPAQKAIREYREEKFSRQSWSTILWTDRKQLYDGFLDSNYGRYFKNTDGSSNAEKHSVLKYLFSNVNFGTVASFQNLQRKSI